MIVYHDYSPDFWISSFTGFLSGKGTGWEKEGIHIVIIKEAVFLG